MSGRRRRRERNKRTTDSQRKKARDRFRKEIFDFCEESVRVSRRHARISLRSFYGEWPCAADEKALFDLVGGWIFCEVSWSKKHICTLHKLSHNSQKIQIRHRSQPSAHHRLDAQGDDYLAPERRFIANSTPWDTQEA